MRTKKLNCNRLEFLGIRKSGGQISIFVSIVFISVLILTGIFIDGSRIIAGEAQVRRAIENAGRSVLAVYNSRLKNDYGLFSLGDIEKENLTENIRDYISKNLLIENNDLESKNSKISPINLYDFRIEEISVTPIINFTRTDITKKQILEYMKYRVPVEITEGILKKAGILKEIGKASKVYQEKMDIDEELGELEKTQQDLKKIISGTLGDGAYNAAYNDTHIVTINYVEKFNKGEVRDLLILNYADLIEEYNSLIIYLQEIERNLDTLEDELLECEILYELLREEELKSRLLKDNSEGSELENIQHEIESILAEIEAIEAQHYLVSKQISQKSREINEIYNYLRGEHTELFIKPNEDGIKYAKKLQDMGSKISSDIERLEELIINSINDKIENNEIENENENLNENNVIEEDTVENNVIGSEFKNAIMEELENLQEIIPDEESTQEMIEIFENNINAIKNAIDALEQVQSMAKSYIVDTKTIRMSKDEILERLMEVNSNYQTVSYNYYFQDKGSAVKDPRKAIEDIAGDIMKKLGDYGVDLVDAGICIEELPSRKKVQDDYFDAEDYNYLDTLVPEAEYEGKLEELGDEIEFSKRSANFSKKAFNFISSIGELLSEKLIDMRDDIYINEYIIMMFKDSVRTKNMAEQDKKMERESFFNAEVEYVLHGHSSENINILKTKGQILLVRFGLNTLGIFTDPEKKQQAYAIAAAIAGWWTGGAGVPIIADLIMCAWGMGEAVSDLSELVDGKSVQLYKTKNAEAMGDILKLTYQDYLRLFLLLKNTENVLDRIQDLIEINMGRIRPEFKMGTTYTAIRVEAVVSMKYMFLTRAFIPSKMKSSDGRHLFRIVLYEGY